MTEETQEVVVEAPEEESSVVTPLAEPTDTRFQKKLKSQKKSRSKKNMKRLGKTRKTFGQRLNELFANFRSVDEDFFEELEETLIGADVGFDTSLKLQKPCDKK